MSAPAFFRFPHTPHLAWLGDGEPRDDKVRTREERDALLSHALVVEEKVAEARKVGSGRNGRMAWEDEQFRYEFDRQHGTLEKYALGTGRWICEVDCEGKMTKSTGGENRRWGRP